MRVRFPMRVYDFDGMLRRHVSSERDPEEKYLVDLTENFENGRCDCMWFKTKLQPVIDKLPMPYIEEQKASDWEGDTYRCKHVTLLKEVIKCELYSQYIKNRRHDAKETKTQSPVDRDPPTEAKAETQASTEAQ